MSKCKKRPSLPKLRVATGILGLVGVAALSNSAHAEPFSVNACVKHWTMEVDRPFRLPLARAKSNCAAAGVTVARLRAQILGQWRRIDDQGKEETRTFSANGTVTETRFQRIAPGRFRKEVRSFPYEVVNYDGKAGQESVSIDGSLHTITIAGNRMYETYMPASFLMEFNWTRVSAPALAQTAPKATYQADNGRMCQIVTFGTNGMSSFGKAAPLRQKTALRAQLPALRKKYPGKTFDVMCEEGD
ncbi:hypothetical protein OKA06_17650 [Novosphingobium sp. MW5]|nr:hypothetical protein [Novosphingobium sp. MW5]